MPSTHPKSPGATENPAIPPNRTDGSVADRSPWRRPSRWLLLIGFWTVFPFALTYVLDLVWDDPFIFPRASVTLFVVLYWWGWIPLSVFVTWLGKRLPLSGPGALRNLAIHVITCGGTAVVYTFWVAGMASVLPLDGAVVRVSRDAFRIFEGFGALSQLLYWTILLGSTAWTRARRRHGGWRSPQKSGVLGQES